MKLFRREIRLPALSRRQWHALGITAAAHSAEGLPEDEKVYK